MAEPKPAGKAAPWYDDPNKLDEEDSRPTPETLAVQIDEPDYIKAAKAAEKARRRAA